MTNPMQKLVDDGVVTIDRDGTIRLTQSAWEMMTTIPSVVAETKRNHDFSKKERDTD